MEIRLDICWNTMKVRKSLYYCLVLKLVKSAPFSGTKKEKDKSSLAGSASMFLNTNTNIILSVCVLYYMVVVQKRHRPRNNRNNPNNRPTIQTFNQRTNLSDTQQSTHPPLPPSLDFFSPPATPGATRREFWPAWRSATQRRFEPTGKGLCPPPPAVHLSRFPVRKKT